MSEEGQEFVVNIRPELLVTLPAGWKPIKIRLTDAADGRIRSVSKVDGKWWWNVEGMGPRHGPFDSMEEAIADIGEVPRKGWRQSSATQIVEPVSRETETPSRARHISAFERADDWFAVYDCRDRIVAGNIQAGFVGDRNETCHLNGVLLGVGTFTLKHLEVHGRLVWGVSLIYDLPVVSGRTDGILIWKRDGDGVREFRAEVDAMAAGSIAVLNDCGWLWTPPSCEGPA